MKLHVIMAQRKEEYDGQHGLEAFDSASEYDYSDNPSYLNEQAKRLLDSNEYKSVEIIDFNVDEGEILKVLCPNKKTLTAKIINKETA